MCTVTIKVKDSLLNKAWVDMDEDVDIAEWMQQQIEAILTKMALSAEKKARAASHSWDNYELSPEILAIAPNKRRSTSTNDQPIPDEVLRLLGAGLPLDDDDLNGRKAYYQHLEEKYQ